MSAPRHSAETSVHDGSTRLVRVVHSTFRTALPAASIASSVACAASTDGSAAARDAALVERFEVEGVLVAVVHPPLIAHRGGKREVELGPSRARRGLVLDRRAALLAELVPGVLRSAARRAGETDF
jgi:hypothetical protein